MPPAYGEGRRTPVGPGAPPSRGDAVRSVADLLGRRLGTLLGRVGRGARARGSSLGGLLRGGRALASRGGGAAGRGAGAAGALGHDLLGLRDGRLDGLPDGGGGL